MQMKDGDSEIKRCNIANDKLFQAVWVIIMALNWF